MAINTITSTLMTISTSILPIPAVRADNRVGIIIQNLHATIDLYIGSSTVATTTGVKIAANGGKIELSHQWQDPIICGVCASSNDAVRVMEISCSAREI